MQSQDEDIRALERAVSETPTDGQARVRLAHALGRKGRRDDAIRALDLASFPDDGFVEARGVANELWRADLSALELATVITLAAREFVVDSAVDATGRFVAFLARRELDVRTLHLHDTLTGRELTVPWRANEGAEGRSLVEIFTDYRGPDPPLVFTDRAFYSVNEVGSVLEVSGLGANLESASTGLIDFGIREFSPDGELVFADGPGAMRGVYRWPTRRRVIEDQRGIGRALDAVSWGEQVALRAMPAGSDGLQVFQLVGFDGIEKAFVGPYHMLQPLGAGIFIAWHRELAIHDIRTGNDVEIAPRSSLREGPPHDVESTPSLSSDERTLRLLVRNVPRCVTLDRAKGCLVGNEDVRSWFVKWEENQLPGRWHPHTAALFVRPAGTRDALVQVPGERIFEVPAGSHAGPWSSDGHTLVVVTRPNEGANRIELWRTPTGRARFS